MLFYMGIYLEFVVVYSSRLQLLDPFNRWDGKDYVDLPILIKVVYGFFI